MPTGGGTRGSAKRIIEVVSITEGLGGKRKRSTLTESENKRKSRPSKVEGGRRPWREGGR